MISIIGAGPVGSYLASLLVGHDDVYLYEEHDKIGEPVQCTGIVTDALSDLIKLKKDFVLNKINRVRLISPNNKVFEIKLKSKDIILDRKEFDRYVVNNAVSKGARLFLKYKFIDYKNNKIKFKNKIIKTDVLVGADGPLSKVAKVSGLWGEREFLIGKQARVKLKNDNSYEVYFNATPDFFGWIVPENKDIARIGVASRNNIDLYFKKFVKGKVLNYQAGLIPVYNRKLKTEKNNVFLVGDAATQVKASTGGGIIPGLIASKELSRAIINKESYEKRWKKSLGKNLYMDLLIRKTLNKFSDEDYNKFFDLLGKNIGTYERDFSCNSLFDLIIKNPRLILFFMKRAKFLYK